MTETKPPVESRPTNGWDFLDKQIGRLSEAVAAVFALLVMLLTVLLATPIGWIILFFAFVFFAKLYGLTPQ